MFRRVFKIETMISDRIWNSNVPSVREDLLSRHEAWVLEEPRKRSGRPVKKSQQLCCD